MLKHLSKALLDTFMSFNSKETPYSRLAETEYTKEYNTLRKFLGRRPTEEEARMLITHQFN